MTQPTSARAPEDVRLRLEVEDRVAGVGHLGEVAAGGVQDALGLTGGAGGVEDEQRVLGVEVLRSVLCGLAADQVVPPHVAAVVPLDVFLAGAAHHQDAAHVLGARAGQRLVDGRLQRAGRALAVAAVGGDHDAGIGVLDAGGQCVGRVAAEDDRVRRADPGAGQQRDGRLGDHRQVDRHTVAGVHPEFGERVGRLADLVFEFRVGDAAAVARLALEVQGDAVAVSGLDVPVDAVVGDVQLPVREPFGEGRVRPVERLGRFGPPAEPAGLLRPRSPADRPSPARTPPL